MEMNTRLQVEHPVTELITGLDLVELQVRIAGGEPLPFAQEDIVLRGHAIEARIYAEDPEAGFLPSTGAVLAFREPSGVRVDAGIRPGSVVTSDYDPMLAKVIVWGGDRAAALDRMAAALEHTAVLGVTTNIAYLRTVFADPDVRAGRMDTGLLGRLPDFVQPIPGQEWFAAAAAHARPTGTGPWQRMRGWRLGTHTTDGVVVRWRDETVPASPGSSADFLVATRDDEVWLARDGRSERFTLADRDARLAEHIAGLVRSTREGAPEVRASMPGTVVAVPVQDGTTVQPGQPLVTVEAMKMEHSMLASVAGTVAIHVAVGDQVRQGQVVATIDPNRDPDSDPDPVPHEGHQGEAP